MQIGLGISPTVMAASGVVITAPAQPTGLTATPISTSQIDLAWTDNATDETAYKVYRSTNGVDYSQVGTDLAADSNSYSDTTITAGTTYYYKVAAVNTGGETLSDASGATNTLLYGLVIALNLNETSGNRADDTGRGNTATQTGTVGYDTGVLGNAAKSANWPTGYLSVAYGADLSLGDNDWAVSVNVYIVTLSGFYALLRQDAAGGRDWNLWFDQTESKIRFEIPGFVVATSGVACTLNAWHHVIFGYDKTTDTIYISVNGEALQTAAKAAGLTDSNYALNFGAALNGGSASPANTRFDRFYRWTRLLTATERAADYAGGAPFALPF